MAQTEEGLQRPFTQGTFQKRLYDFEELMKEVTLQDVEATPEERRQMITGLTPRSLLYKNISQIAMLIYFKRRFILHPAVSPVSFSHHMNSITIF